MIKGNAFLGKGVQMGLNMVTVGALQRRERKIHKENMEPTQTIRKMDLSSMPPTY